MIPNCKGCKEEIEWAYEYQQMGYHLATNPFIKGHFIIIMLDDKDKIVVKWKQTAFTADVK